MNRTWDVIRRYGTQSVMKVGLNQSIMHEVLEKLKGLTESDGLTESVTEYSADEYPIAKKQPVKRAKNGLKRLKSKAGSKTVNSKVIKTKTSAVVTSLAKMSRPNENGQRDRAAPSGGEKENLILHMLLAGLISTASKLRKSERTLVDTNLEMEVIRNYGTGGLDDYKPSRTIMG